MSTPKTRGDRGRYPDWLVSIGASIDELVSTTGGMATFRDAVREAARRKGPVQVFPARAMEYSEKLALLAAIHDEVCRDAEVIDPWEPTKYSEGRGAPAVPYIMLRNFVRERAWDVRKDAERVGSCLKLAQDELRLADVHTAENTRDIAPVDALVRLLATAVDDGLRVELLPSVLRNPDMLTELDGDDLIEFGRRKHSFTGPVSAPRLILERGFEWFHVTVPQRNPLIRILTDDEAERPELRLYVRLTAKGRIRASKLANAERAGAESTDSELLNSLTDRQRNCLQVLREQKATCADARKNADEIARLADGRAANCDGFKSPLAQLVEHRLIQSKGGRGGGYWLSERGQRLAEIHADT